MAHGVHCHGHSTMNVSHHVEMKCAFIVWGPSTHICRQTSVWHTKHIYSWRKHYGSFCLIFNIFHFLAFQFYFSLPTWCHPGVLVVQRFSLSIKLCHFISFFYQPNNARHTHTHTLPTLLLLTAVCSETVKSLCCRLSGDPLMKRFYVAKLMQLFFSGQ